MQSETGSLHTPSIIQFKYIHTLLPLPQRGFSEAIQLKQK